MTEQIRYSIPNVGPVEIPLYPPAGELYDLLGEAGEVDRLKDLAHIGALQSAYPGVSHTRWDYTVSMLYVITRIRSSLGNCGFELASVSFSSEAAALQCLALLANVGHLPGIYSVEKGVGRYLLADDTDSRLTEAMRHAGLCPSSARIRSLIRNGFYRLQTDDYIAVSRLLGAVKLASGFFGKTSTADPYYDFYSEFFRLTDFRESRRWAKLDEYFDATRRLAYLNQDGALVASPITVGLSPLLSSFVDTAGITEQGLRQSGEILGAFEHLVYERFYHRFDARKVAAVAADCIVSHLAADAAPEESIVSWMSEGGFCPTECQTQLTTGMDQTRRIGSISLRSFFTALPMPLYRTEEGLAKRLAKSATDACAVCVLRYVARESQHGLEPDHVYLDAYVRREPTAADVGRLLHWVADELDDYGEQPGDGTFWVRKPEIGRIYHQLVCRLTALAWPTFSLDMQAWPLSRLGKFGDAVGEFEDVAVWLAAPDLDDATTRHVVRRTRLGGAAYRSLRDELTGLRELRVELRRQHRQMKAPPRRRYFLLTGSIVLRSRTNELEREFDGGILRLSPRTGAASLYLLETKGASTSTRARNVLKRKLEALGIAATVHRLGRHSAYGEAPLSATALT
jgi:hypothetical protein